MKYNVTYHLNDGEGKTEIFKSVVSFYKHPNQYGNGYGMHIKSSAEPFGASVIDIRYDKTFNPLFPIPYIVQHYASRFTGYDGSWKLIGIRVHEAEYEE